jgi:hypothetical protein
MSGARWGGPTCEGGTATPDVCAHVCMYVHVCMCVWMYGKGPLVREEQPPLLRLYVCTYARIYVDACTCACPFVMKDRLLCSGCVYVKICTCICMHTCVRVHVSVHV